MAKKFLAALLLGAMLAVAPVGATPATADRCGPAHAQSRGCDDRQDRGDSKGSGGSAATEKIRVALEKLLDELRKRLDRDAPAPAPAKPAPAPAKPAPAKPAPAKPDPGQPSKPSKPDNPAPEPTKPEPSKPEPSIPEPGRPTPADPKPSPSKPGPVTSPQQPTAPKPATPDTVVPAKPQSNPNAPKPAPVPQRGPNHGGVPENRSPGGPVAVSPPHPEAAHPATALPIAQGGADPGAAGAPGTGVGAIFPLWADQFDRVDRSADAAWPAVSTIGERSGLEWIPPAGALLAAFALGGVVFTLFRVPRGAVGRPSRD